MSGGVILAAALGLALAVGTPEASKAGGRGQAPGRNPDPSVTALPAASVRCAARRFADVPAAEAPAIVEEVSRAPGGFTARLLDASARFLGTPYRLDPLGEGSGAPDPDPLLRFDEVDCMTFVETAIALAQGGPPETLEARLTAIRYADAGPAFENRHHFFTAQWVPAQRRRGILRDVTSALAGEAGHPELAVRHVKEISRRDWQERTAGRRFSLPDSRAPIGSHQLSYVPIARVLELAARIPSGTLFALVREDRPRSPFLVTHVGFVVQHGGKTWLRHAGRDIYGQVVDEEIGHYVRRAARYRKWRVLGMQFFEIQSPPGPSRAAFESAQSLAME